MEQGTPTSGWLRLVYAILSRHGCTVTIKGYTLLEANFAVMEGEIVRAGFLCGAPGQDCDMALHASRAARERRLIWQLAAETALTGGQSPQQPRIIRAEWHASLGNR